MRVALALAGLLSAFGCSDAAAVSDSPVAGASTGGESKAGQAATSGGGGNPSVAGGGGGVTSGGVANGGVTNGGATNGGATNGGASEGGATSGGFSGGGVTSGGTAGSAGATTGEYRPCPAAPEPCKIMPSGDSITVGAQSTDTGGYRVPLFALALEKAQNLTFVGPGGAGPSTVKGVAFPDAHDGHSGYIIDTVDTRKGLLPLMQQNLTKHTPHIVILMIGTNDMNSKVDIANAPKRFAALIDLVTTTAPQTLLVVAKLIPTRTDSLNGDVQTFNSAVATLVDERVRAGKHLQLVDMYGAFTSNASYKTDWLFDGLHPNDAGYAVMAKTWHAAIASFLTPKP